VFQAILADLARYLHAATIGERIVGSADLVIVANLTHHSRPWAVIENVVVTAPARRHGAAPALLRQLMEIASAAGWYKSPAPLRQAAVTGPRTL
jgi:GNAT superfamily N-acetyltransferase